MILFLWSRFEVKICSIFPKRKMYAPNLVYFSKYTKMYQKISEKLEKCGGKRWSFLPWI